MKNTFSRMTVVALTMWLGLAAGTANAVPTITAFSGSAINGYNANFGNTNVASSFSNWFSFSIPEGSSGNGEANAISLSGSNVVFTAFNLFESSNLIATGTLGLIPYLSFMGGAVPGNYSLNVAGNKTGTRTGSYAGNIAVSPVPEPGIYAMMLAGLGLLGFSARRRKNNG